MTTPNLGKIELVPNLRETWPNEAQHFTPWLAEDLDQLGDALGMDLELRQVEAAVGGYSLDILATDLHSSRPVIIENQLEATDHAHLGQLLTYAAGFDAEAIVWVTRDFRDEHRAALDWLNQRTNDDTQFFGVAVELWRIGDSALAPHFRVVASPNGWGKQQRRGAAESPQDERNYEWRGVLIDSLRNDHGYTFKRTREAKATWMYLEPLVPHVWQIAVWRKGNPGLQLIIEREGSDGQKWNQGLFEALERRRHDIEEMIWDSSQEERPVWDSAEGKQKSRITIIREGNVYDQPENWQSYVSWMLSKVLLFREAFRPYVNEFIEQEQATFE